jgi:hypothetical protein
MLGRSCSLTRARICTVDVSMISSTMRPGRTVSPTRYSGSVMPVKNMFVVSRFSRTTTDPSMGAVTFS